MTAINKIFRFIVKIGLFGNKIQCIGCPILVPAYRLLGRLMTRKNIIIDEKFLLIGFVFLIFWIILTWRSCPKSIQRIVLSSLSEINFPGTIFKFHVFKRTVGCGLPKSIPRVKPNSCVTFFQSYAGVSKAISNKNINKLTRCPFDPVYWSQKSNRRI